MKPSPPSRISIEASCDDVGLIGIGNGRINAYRAVISSPLPTGTIAGKVTDAADGSPIEGATVSDGTRSAVSDANGNYTIVNIPEGSYTVTASKGGYETQSISVAVISGQTTNVDFALTMTLGSITGKVTDTIDGSPIERATVIDGKTFAVTDANGIYTLSDIPQGDYTLTASKEGYETASQDVTVVSGQTTTANFNLVRISSPTKPMWINNITFRGKGKDLRFDVVVVDGNAVVAGARIAVELIWNESRIWVFDGTTDDSGIARFMVRRAPAGNYVATVNSISASGYTWDTDHGITSASYTLDRRGGKPRKNKLK